MRDAVLRFLGPWAWPTETPPRAAMVMAVILALAALAPGGTEALAIFSQSALHRQTRTRFLTITGFVAAFLSLGYIAYYLRGGPRIIDASTYFLQGRALAHGKFAWPIVDPTASFRGRFLLFHNSRLGGIFPPGYPLLLSLGFLVGAPMVMGPLIAAGLVVATYLLARELAEGALPAVAAGPATAVTRWHVNGAETREYAVEAVARLAALLSIASAALRYHTADTMSHGASALGVALALTAALRGRRIASGARARRLFLLAGLAVGYVAATRLPSAVPIGAAVLWLAAGSEPALVAAAGIGFLPGLLLLAFAQRAVTGSFWQATQRAYYAVSDGPPGCFRYGFGEKVGCHFEHGDYVQQGMPTGFGFLAALRVTLRRVYGHLGDAANFAPLDFLMAIPVVRALRAGARARSPILVAAAVPLGFVLVYAPFYFDGSYPGAGARFYADVLPIEHALLAIAIMLCLPKVAFPQKAAALLAVSVMAFAVHASAWHSQLAERDGGRPMFEPDVLRKANAEKGLLFVDSDHGFDLAYDPAVGAGADLTKRLLVARLRKDDHDKILYERLGRPLTHVYKLTDAGPQVVPWTPAASGARYGAYRMESEAEWPPLAQADGWIEPRWATGTCASAGRVLALIPTPLAPSRASNNGPPSPAAAPEHVVSSHATAWIDLAFPEPGSWLVIPRLLLMGTHGKGRIVVVPAVPGEMAPPREPPTPVAAEWSTADPPRPGKPAAAGDPLPPPGPPLPPLLDGPPPECRSLQALRVEVPASRAWVRLEGELYEGTPAADASSAGSRAPGEQPSEPPAVAADGPLPAIAIDAIDISR